MATYAIGDVWGYFTELTALLKEIGFAPDLDPLLFSKTILIHWFLVSLREPFSQVTIGSQNLRWA